MPPKGRIRNLTNSRMLEENLDAAITVQQYRERRRASLFRLESVNQGQIQSINLKRAVSPCQRSPIR
jgi:hypothetical protein